MSDVEIVPACINIEVERGTDNTFEFTLMDNDGKAISIITDDVVLSIKDSYDGVLQFQETSLAGSHFDGANGKVEFTVPRTAIDDEANAKVRTFWVYEIRRIDIPNDEEHVHIKGEFIIEPSVGV